VRGASRGRKAVAFLRERLLGPTLLQTALGFLREPKRARKPLSFTSRLRVDLLLGEPTRLSGGLCEVRDRTDPPPHYTVWVHAG